MIGITGYMSGGKSYYAVEHMLGMLIRGHRICTNIRLNCVEVTRYTAISCVFWKRLYYYLTDVPSGFHEIQTEDYKNYPIGSPRGTLEYEQNMCYIYLDEASSIFDSMTHTADSSIKAVAAWARHTEKRGQRIFLIMQFSSELHKRLRVHIVEFVHCTNTSTLKLPYIGLGLPRLLRDFTIRTRYLADETTMIGFSKWYKLNPSIYRCYKTSQIVVGSNDVDSYVPVHLDLSYRHKMQAKQTFVFLLVVYAFLLIGSAVIWFMVLQ